MAEMWTRSPIMQGNTEQHQLALISQLCGSITPEVCSQASGPGVQKSKSLWTVVWRGGCLMEGLGLLFRALWVFISLLNLLVF